jgi:flagellin
VSIIGPNSVGGYGSLQRQYQRNNQQISQSLERLSTGKRINRASDDPSGFVLAESLRGDLVELRAESKVADAQRLRSHQKESALSHIQKVLTHLRGSLGTAADGQNTPTQSRAIQQEIDASLDAIDQIAGRVDGVAGSEALSALREGGEFNVIDGDVAAATELLEEKLSSLSNARAAIGAYERAHLDTFQRIREDQIVITTEALSQTEDADFAEEASNLIRSQILTQASLAAIVFSANEQYNLIESLLEGIGKRFNAAS